MMTASSRVHGLTIGDLFGVDAPPAARQLPVANIAMDSRHVTPGSLFLAVAGERHHGLDFLRQATDAGATAVAWEPSSGETAPVIAPPAVCFPIPGLKSRLGDIADRFFGAPSRVADVLGITGTNGKTTCAHLTASALGLSGRRTGYIGTIGAGFPGHLSVTELTTADVVETHRRLAELIENGARAAAVEVSSHALVQDRVQGVRFKVAAFTNLSRDHLDYHGDMQSYAAAKRKLFTVPGLQWAVANTDDAAGPGMLQAARPGTGKVAVGSQPCPVADRNLVVRGVSSQSDGLTVVLDGDWGEMEVRSRLLGRFNAENLSLALAMLLVMEVPQDAACEVLSRTSAPPGRMEIFRNRDPEGPVVVIDYAHTPDALAKALEAVRAHCRGRVIVVFGCGGDRDPGKRAEMGRVAEAGADTVIVTDDNPRSEDGGRIVADILEGMRGEPRVIRERETAIATAVQEAGPGDIVLVAGKGHEDYQLVGAQRLHFSDRAVAARLTGGAA